MKYGHLTELEKCEQLAIVFGERLLKEIGEAKYAAAVKWNKQHPHSHACASHDHCDANMVFLASVAEVWECDEDRALEFLDDDRGVQMAWVLWRRSEPLYDYRMETQEAFLERCFSKVGPSSNYCVWAVMGDDANYVLVDDEEKPLLMLYRRVLDRNGAEEDLIEMASIQWHWDQPVNEAFIARMQTFAQYGFDCSNHQGGHGAQDPKFPLGR